MTPDGYGLQEGSRDLRVEDLVSKDLKPRSFNGTWISGQKKIKSKLMPQNYPIEAGIIALGSKLLVQDSSRGLSIIDFSTNKTEIFMTNSTFVSLKSFKLNKFAILD